MKLQIFHHNGQLAEYELEAVTGLRVVAEHFEEVIQAEIQDLNAKLHAAIDKPGVPDPTSVPPTAPPSPSSPLPVTPNDPAPTTTDPEPEPAPVDPAPAPEPPVEAVPVDPPVADPNTESAAPSTESSTTTEPAA